MPDAPEPELGWGSRVRWGGAVLVVAAGLLYLTWSVLSVLTAATVFAYLLDRPVSWLERRGLSRSFAFVLLLIAGVTAVTVGTVVVVPLVVHQIGDLATNLTPYLQKLALQVAPYKSQLEARLGVAIPLDVSELNDVAPEYLRRIAAVPNAGQALKDVLAGVAGGGVSVVVSLLTLTLLPVFTFYVCHDWGRIVGWMDEMVPPRWRASVRVIAVEIDRRTMAFVEGQLILVVIMSALYSVGLSIAGIDLALVVGVGSGLLFVVPYVGTLVGLGLSVTLALLKFGLDWHVVMCVATYTGVQLLEGSILTPSIVGDRVGLPPLVVMVGVVVGGNLLGIWGLMVAVPLTAALSVLIGSAVSLYRQSQFYRG